MNVNFEYYRIFYYVAKYRNFTKAARVLGNSQPNITRAMNCLEQQVHATLFIRTNRGVQLTSEGEELYNYVSAAMIQIFAAEKALSENDGLLHGNIVIGTSETALNIFLLCKLKAFRTAYPGIRLKIYNYSSPQAIAAVKSGKIDFAVLSTPVPAEPPLHLTPLQSFREILIGGPSFSALSEKELCFSDLKKYPFICLGRETATFQFYNQLFLSQELELIPDTEAATTDQILPLVKNNLGLAFLPEPMALESLAKQEVLQIAISEKLPLRHICLVHDHQHPLNSGARELKKIILGERMD